MLIKTKRQITVLLFVIFTLILGHQFYYQYTKRNKNLYIPNFENYEHIDQYFGTKSRYPVPKDTNDLNTLPNSNFKLKQVQLVCRHGTRYPTGSKGFNSKIEELVKFLYEFPGLFPDQFEFLESFENPYHDDDYGLLVQQGVMDMQGIAKRAMKRYPTIFQTINNISEIPTSSTNITRVIDSALAFLSTVEINISNKNKDRPIYYTNPENLSKTTTVIDNDNELDDDIFIDYHHKSKVDITTEENEIEDKAKTLNHDLSDKIEKTENDNHVSESYTMDLQDEEEITENVERMKKDHLKQNIEFFNTMRRMNKKDLIVDNEENFDLQLELISDIYDNDKKYLQDDKLLESIDIIPNREDDLVLAPHISCPQFSKVVDNVYNDTRRQELNDIINQLEKNYIKSAIDDIEKVFKIPSLSIPDEIGESVMFMCIFEVAHNNTRNQFCSLLQEKTFELYSYYEDFRNYYIKGYGNIVNEWLAAPLLKSIVEGFNKEIHGKIDKTFETFSNEEKKNDNIILRFAHAETIFPLTSVLGLFKDKKPISLDDAPPNRNYLFKSSMISPFAANYWFELYECETKYIKDYNRKKDTEYIKTKLSDDVSLPTSKAVFVNLNKKDTRRYVIDNENDNKDSIKEKEDIIIEKTYIIRILLNENEIIIPNCKPVVIVDPVTREMTEYPTFCLLSQFKRLYSDILNTSLEDYTLNCNKNQ